MFEGGLDIVLMVIMGYFFLRGLFRGVVQEIVAVLGVFVAFWVASIYWPLGEEHLKAIFELPGQRGIISFIIIFVVVYFLIGIISIFIDKIVKIAISPVISALLGSAVGVGKGVLFCAVILIGAETFLKPTDKLFTSSNLLPIIKPVSEQARAWLHDPLVEKIADAAKRSMPSFSGLKAPDRKPGSQSISMDSVDWSTIQSLLTTRPNDISPAWRDKLKSIAGGEAMTKEDIKRFISDHPSLFTTPAPVNPADADNKTGVSTAPSWPQPATE